MQRLTPEDLIRDVSKVGDFSLSPNALEVAFSWQSDNESNIYISSIPELEPRQITFGKEHRVLPLWSPDSSKIAFLQDNDGDESFNLFTVSLCDGEVHQITEFKGCNFRGYSWSPNGDYLAFAANIDGCYSIFIIQSDGRGLRRLTSATRHDILPQWSPKGDYIVYTKHESGNKFSSVQIINMNGIREASKCSAKSSLTAKTWDSNGIRIVSHCMKPGSKNLGLFQPDTGRVLWIQEEECELGRVWSKDGNYSACVIDNKRNSQMVILDNSNGTKKMIGPGRGLSEEPEFSYDNRFVVFFARRPSKPIRSLSLRYCKR